jgi:hypothetical protein
MNPSAPNYNTESTFDDGSCVDPNIGCKDPNATNFDPDALIEDNSLCEYDDVCVIDDKPEEFAEKLEEYRENIRRAESYLAKYTLFYDRDGKPTLLQPEISDEDAEGMQKLLNDTSGIRLRECAVNFPIEEQHYMAVYLRERIKEILNFAGIGSKVW